MHQRTTTPTVTKTSITIKAARRPTGLAPVATPVIGEDKPQMYRPNLTTTQRTRPEIPQMIMPVQLTLS